MKLIFRFLRLFRYAPVTADERSMLYHYKGCAHLSRTVFEERRWFLNAEQAEHNWFELCPLCHEDLFYREVARLRREAKELVAKVRRDPLVADRLGLW